MIFLFLDPRVLLVGSRLALLSGPAEPALAIRAEKCRITTNEAKRWVKHLAYFTATKFYFASTALLHKLTSWQPINNRDELSCVARGTAAPLSQTLCLRGVLHVTSSNSW
jgi:hypothetical protein